MSARSRSPMSVRRKLAFSLVVCVLTFGVQELLLWTLQIPETATADQTLAGFSGAEIFQQLDSASDDCRRRTVESMLAWFNAQEFACQKPPNTFRIICLGGSTTYGRPYDDRTSFAGWLRAFAEQVVPDQDVEVINAGGISYGSHRVLQVLQETVEYQPDLLVVYCGHNEFLERTTYSRLTSLPQPLVQSAELLNRLRTVRALRQLVGGSDPNPVSAKQVPQQQLQTILDSSVGLDAYQRDPDWNRQVLAAYRDNLQQMIDVAAAADVPIVFVTPACQLRDCAPFKSQPGESLSRRQIAYCRELEHRVQGLLKQDQAAEALPLAERLVQLDPVYAHSQFLLGQALWMTQQYAAADAAFQRARDLDVCPLRATSQLQQTLQQVVRDRQVPLIDFVRRVNELAEHGVPGADLFLDHVHPTIEGNRQLALMLLQFLDETQMLPRTRSEYDQRITEVTQRVLSGIDATAHGNALVNLSKVLSWAGKYDEADRLAIQAATMLPDDSEAQYQAGSAWYRAGQLDNALQAYQAAAEAQPESAQALYGLGLIMLDTGQYQQAVDYYQQAQQLQPDFLDIEFNLGRAWELSGQLSSAAAQYRRCLELNPEFVPAWNGLGTVAAQQGQLSEAISCFQQALQLDPDDPNAQANLQRALNQRN